MSFESFVMEANQLVDNDRQFQQGCFSNKFKQNLLACIKNLLNSSYNTLEPKQILIGLITIRSLNLAYESSCWIGDRGRLDNLINSLIRRLRPFVSYQFSSETLQKKAVEFHQANTRMDRCRHRFQITDDDETPVNYFWSSCVGIITKKYMNRYFDNCLQRVIDECLRTPAYLAVTALTSAFVRSNSSNQLKYSIFALTPNVAELTGVPKDERTNLNKYVERYSHSKVHTNICKL